MLELVDGAVPGLRLRVTPAGTKTRSLNIRAAGVMRRFDVGSGFGSQRLEREPKKLRRRIEMGADPTVVRHDDQDENCATIRMKMCRHRVTKEGRSPTVDTPTAAAAPMASSDGNGGWIRISLLCQEDQLLPPTRHRSSDEASQNLHRKRSPRLPARRPIQHGIRLPFETDLHFPGKRRRVENDAEPIPSRCSDDESCRC